MLVSAELGAASWAKAGLAKKAAVVKSNAVRALIFCTPLLRRLLGCKWSDLKPTPQCSAQTQQRNVDLLVELCEFRSFERQVVHQSLLPEDECDDRVFQVVRIYGPAGSQSH